MMKIRITAAALALLLLASCATSTVMHQPADGQKTLDGHPAAMHVEGMISGVYLFYWLPLWSGKWTRPNRQDYDVFTDNVKPRFVYNMLDAYSWQHGWGKVEDVTLSESSAGWIGLWIVWKRSIHASGLATEKK